MGQRRTLQSRVAGCWVNGYARALMTRERFQGIGTEHLHLRFPPTPTLRLIRECLRIEERFSLHESLACECVLSMLDLEQE